MRALESTPRITHWSKLGCKVLSTATDAAGNDYISEVSKAFKSAWCRCDPDVHQLYYAALTLSYVSMYNMYNTLAMMPWFTGKLTC